MLFRPLKYHCACVYECVCVYVRACVHVCGVGVYVLSVCMCVVCASVICYM